MSETIQLCGYPINVRTYRAKGATVPTILALHGFTGSGLDFLPLRDAMGVDRWNWICPDLMGHGQSACPEVIDPYCLESMLRLVSMARERAHGGAPVYLLGYSMGGRLALHFASRVQNIRTAVIGSSPGIDGMPERQRRREQDQKLVDLLSRQPIDIFCRFWEEQPLIEPQTRLPEPIGKELANRRRMNLPAGLTHTLLACGSGTLPSLWNRLDSLSGIHCLFGQNDIKFKGISDQMHAVNPRITPHSIAKSGHATHLENPKETALVLESVFSR